MEPSGLDVGKTGKGKRIDNAMGDKQTSVNAVDDASRELAERPAADGSATTIAARESPTPVPINREDEENHASALKRVAKSERHPFRRRSSFIEHINHFTLD